MKLYIPTCTLNFNNIFSTESISPIGYYKKRGFGNKRFYGVPANNREDVVTLYSKLPRFNVENTEMENFPIVIEIDTKDYPERYFHKVNEIDDVDIYYCTHTLYLNPFHSLVYFYNYESLQDVLSKSEHSLENKFSKLYSSNFIVKPVQKKSWIGNIFTQTERDDFEWTPSFSKFEVPRVEETFDNDCIIDRVKGFLYCYLIGANQSVSPETSKLKSIARNLRNTLSAVVNSPERRPSQLQDDILLNGINEFNKLYSEKDENSRINKEIIDSKLSQNPLGISNEDCYTFLKWIGLYDSFLSQLPLTRVYDAGELWSCIEYPEMDVFNRVINNMQTAVKRIETKDISSSQKKSIANLIEVIPELCVRVRGDESISVKFFEIFINSQIHAEYKSIMEDNGVEEPLAEAFQGGQILKSLMGEKWTDSSASNYLKGLLNYFQENTSFELFSFNNRVLNSFAAFCQKGDNIDRLSDYLLQCGFSDYSIAYGLYGATRGFASLPKTFTNNFINGDREYLKQEYSQIYSYLFHIPLRDTEFHEKERNDVDILTQNEIGTKIMGNLSIIEPQPKKQNEVIKAVAQAVSLEDEVQSPKAFMYILDSFPNIKKTNAFKALVKADFENDNREYTLESFRQRIYSIIVENEGKKALKSKKKDIDRAIELESLRQDPEAFLKILDNFMKPSTAAYRRITLLIQDVPKIKKFPNSEISSIRFSAAYIEQITDIIRVINPQLDDFAIKQLRNDLKWIFDPIYSRGKSEIELLESFKRNLISGKKEPVSKNGKDMRWKNEAYQPLDVEKTIQILKGKLH